MSMTLDRETAMLSAQKLRLMQRGNIVVLVSLAAILANAILSLVLALNNPFALMRGGIGTMVVFMIIGVVAMAVGSIMYLVGLYGMGRVRPEYQKAFLIEIVLLILGIVYNMLGKEGFLAETVNVIRNLGCWWSSGWCSRARGACWTAWSRRLFCGGARECGSYMSCQS